MVKVSKYCKVSLFADDAFININASSSPKKTRLRNILSPQKLNSMRKCSTLLKDKSFDCPELDNKSV